MEQLNQATNNNEIQGLTIRLPKHLWKRARHFAVEKETSVQDLVAVSLEKYLSEQSEPVGARS